MGVTPADSNAINIECEADRPQWFAICTNPKQEDRAYHNLEASSVECFNPRIKECRRNQFTGGGHAYLKALVSKIYFCSL
jgi:Transcription termination factor nusG